ncbi:hypothetical protein CB0940_04517 [Cercospora beticola]|uniref:Uncharacterized protein n=1 Tax=Cercospora beticola TaxID=122368 RepID=A0A2G5HLR5_CERBT|nr:hypothetical protein CB0940_04517 [Cercospora beticola]PIA93173.1 hypothetical protein CB0940_04517 [Cercospora beticola]
MPSLVRACQLFQTAIMSTTATLVVGALVGSTLASYPGSSWKPKHNNHSPWDLKKFTSLVTFGDSYTDDSRLSYLGQTNGSLPPVGYANPAVSQVLHDRYCITNAPCRTTTLRVVVDHGLNT